MQNIQEITILMFIQEIQDKLNNPSSFEKVFNLPECEKEFIKLIKGIPLYQINTLRDDVRTLSDSIVRFNKIIIKKHNWQSPLILLASLQHIAFMTMTNKHVTMSSIVQVTENFPFLTDVIIASINTAVNANRVPEKALHGL